MEVNEEEIAKYLPNISRKLGWLTEQDLIKRIVSLEFNRLIDYYRDTPDLDIPDENTRKPKEGNFAKEGRNGRKKDIRTAEAGFERIYINLGKAHGFFPPNLIEMVNSLVPGRVNIPEGTIRKAGPDETVLPPRQRETHTRPRREKDKCAVAQTSDYLNIQM